MPPSPSRCPATLPGRSCPRPAVSTSTTANSFVFFSLQIVFVQKTCQFTCFKTLSSELVAGPSGRLVFLVTQKRAHGRGLSPGRPAEQWPLPGSPSKGVPVTSAPQLPQRGLSLSSFTGRFPRSPGSQPRKRAASKPGNISAEIFTPRKCNVLRRDPNSLRPVCPVALGGPTG